MSFTTKKVLDDVAKDKIPEWLNDDFFIATVEKKLNLSSDKFTSKILSIKPAVSTGENYISGLYRVKIEVKNLENGSIEEYSFILKNALNTTNNEPIVPGVFTKEIDIYSNCIPAFENEYKMIGEDVQFGPKCYKATTEPVDILLFDDLCEQGYNVANRQVGLDWEHSKFFLSKLAKFHAASVVYKEKHGVYSDIYKTFYNLEMKENFDKWLDMFFPKFLATAESSDILRPLSNKLKKWPAKFLDNLIYTMTPHADSFNVLIHGDAWTNNFMFKYDSNNQIEDILLIDYQICIYASPAIDLHYFFVATTRIDLKVEMYDKMIQFYHSELVKNLTNLGYQKKILTLKELHIDMLKLGGFGATLTYGALALFLLDQRDDASAEIMMSEGAEGSVLREAMYSTPRYIKALEVILPFYDKRGMLEL